MGGDLAEVRHADLHVAHGGVDPLVAQHVCYRLRVDPRIRHVGGGRSPQAVSAVVRVDAGPSRGKRHRGLDLVRLHRIADGVDEQGPGARVRLPAQNGPLDGASGVRAEGRRSGRLAFGALHGEGAFGPIHVWVRSRPCRGTCARSAPTPPRPRRPGRRCRRRQVDA